MALVAGAVISLSRKGTRAHVRWGWTYVLAMVGLNITALMIYRLFGHFGPFHAAAIFSLVTVVAGVIPAVRKSNRHWLFRHAYWMAGSYVGLCAALVAEIATRTDWLPFWWMTVIASLAVFVVGGTLIARHVPKAIVGMKRGPSSGMTDRIYNLES